MEVFGSYETVREISSDLIGAVYSAHRKGESGTPAYAVKVIGKSQLGLSPIIDASVSDANDPSQIFKVSIARQENAASGSSYVAPVLESDSDDQHAWYATYLYARTPVDLIQGRVTLSGAAIHHILLSVALGLEAFHKSCHHGHGNLKLSNIFLSKQDNIAKADVCVADPSGLEEARSGEFEAADRMALGRLLCQLVLGKDLSESADWLVQSLHEGPEWKQAFANQASAWLDLCKELLDPKTSSESLPWAEIVRRLRVLKPKEDLSKPMLVAGGAFVFFIVGLAAWLLWPDPPDGMVTITVQVDPPNVQVSINGADYSNIPISGKKVRLNPGHHRFVGTYDGGPGEFDNLTPFAETLEITEDNDGQPIRIALDYGSMQISSEPDNAQVALFDMSIAGEATPRETGLSPEQLTPLTIRVIRPGTYKVQLKKERYLTGSSSPTNVSTGATANVSVTLEKQKPGLHEVKLSSSPFEAKVISITRDPSTERLNMADLVESLANIDHKSSTSIQLPPGKYTFVATSRNFSQLTKELTIENTPDNPKEYLLVFQFPNTELRLRSDPKGAQVFANGVDVSTNANSTEEVTTPFIAFWPPGKVEFWFTLDNHYSATSHVTLTAGKTEPISLNLRPKRGIILVNFIPSNPAVKFTVKRIEEGTEPVTSEEGILGVRSAMEFSMPPGTYEIHATHPHLSSVSSKVTLDLGQTIELPMRFPHGKVRFMVDPPEIVEASETTLTIEGEPKVRLDPFNPANSTLALAPGDYGYSAENTRLGPLEGTFSVQDSEETEEVTLKFKYGSVTITSEPSQANVFLVNQDGSKGDSLGQTPLNYWDRPGDYQYILERETYDPKRKRVALKDQEPVDLHVDFNQVLPDPFENSIGMSLIDFEDISGYSIGVYEVTQLEYFKVMGQVDSTLEQPSEDKGRLPVEGISVSNAIEFCNRLTSLDRQAGKLPNDRSYRLPTENEWRQYEGDASETNPVFKPVSPNGPRVVGSSEIHNQFGLYDVHGNVPEYVYIVKKDGYRTFGGGYISIGHDDFFGNPLITNRSQKPGGAGFRVVLASGPD